MHTCKYTYALTRVHSDAHTNAPDISINKPLT